MRVSSDRQLFIDDEIIDTLENCRKQFHRPRRHPENPVIEADRPWERGLDGVYLFGGTVLYDEEERIFKMWYRTDTMIFPPGAPGGIVPEGGYKACYAISEDGRNWIKPDLGLVDHEGSTKNNLIPPPAPAGGSYGIRRPNIIKDFNEEDPSKRYKMLYIDSITEDGVRKGVVIPAYSEDGLQWRMDRAKATHFPKPLLVNGELSGWDDALQKYVYYHRKNRGQMPADVDGRRMRDEESIVQSTSSDFEEWGETQVAIRRSETDPPGFGTGWPGILNPVRYTGDFYIGVMDTCTNYWVEDVLESSWDIYAGTHCDIRPEWVVRRAVASHRAALAGAAARSVGRMGCRSHFSIETCDQG